VCESEDRGGGGEGGRGEEGVLVVNILISYLTITT